jgi:hypothetical protein
MSPAFVGGVEGAIPTARVRRQSGTKNDLDAHRHDDERAGCADRPLITARAHQLDSFEGGSDDYEACPLASHFGKRPRWAARCDDPTHVGAPRGFGNQRIDQLADSSPFVRSVVRARAPYRGGRLQTFARRAGDDERDGQPLREPRSDLDHRPWVDIVIDSAEHWLLRVSRGQSIELLPYLCFSEWGARRLDLSAGLQFRGTPGLERAPEASDPEEGADSDPA